MIEVTYHRSTVQSLVRNGLLVVIVLLLCCSVSSDRTDAQFFVDARTTSTSISPSPCHLQTKQRPARKRKASIKKRKCSGCGGEGHDRRNCPAGPAAAPRKAARKQVVQPDAVEEAPQQPPLDAPVVENTPTVDLDKVLYVVFDLETTGRSWPHSEIIELAAQILDPNRIPVEDAIFSELIKPNTPIPPLITELTTITIDMVSTAEHFSEVAINFREFMRRHANEYSVGHDNVRSHGICSQGCYLYWEIYLHHFRLIRKEEDSASCGAIGGTICRNLPSNLRRSILHIHRFAEVFDQQTAIPDQYSLGQQNSSYDSDGEDFVYFQEDE
jgi:Exonuclease